MNVLTEHGRFSKSEPVFVFIDVERGDTLQIEKTMPETVGKIVMLMLIYTLLAT